MAEFYKWDFERILHLSVQVGNEVGNLKRDAIVLTTIRGTIEKSWQSVSGQEYVGNLEFNKAEIDLMITEAEEMRDDLQRAAKIYGAAEKEIDGIISHMRSQISH